MFTNVFLRAFTTNLEGKELHLLRGLRSDPPKSSRVQRAVEIHYYTKPCFCCQIKCIFAQISSAEIGFTQRFEENQSAVPFVGCRRYGHSHAAV